MLSEYDFAGGVRGTHRQRAGDYSHVVIHRDDGSCTEGDMVSLPFRTGRCGAELCVRVIQREWPDVVFVNPDGGERIEAAPAAGLADLLIFRDAGAAQASGGRPNAPGARDAWIRLAFSERELTLLVDDAESPYFQRILRSLRDALQTDFFKHFRLARVPS